MEKDAKYFIVGLFVSICLVCLTGFLIWIAGTHDSEDYQNYTVYFTDSISGLKEGGSVQYKGVEVGKVVDIRLAPERKDLIKVDIEVVRNTPLRAGTEASLAVLGVTGLVYMEMTTKLEDTQPVPRVPGERYPVIQGSGTQLAKLFQDIPSITQQILEMTQKINTLMDDDNMATLNTTLKNIENMTRDMNGLLSTDNVANASAMLENFSESSADMKDMIARFEKTADQIDQTVTSINTIVTKNEASFNRFSQEGLNQIVATSREAQKTAAAIRRTADKLSQDPSQIIYKPQTQGVSIPK